MRLSTLFRKNVPVLRYFFDTCFLILDKFYETFVEGLYVNRSADDDLTLMQSVKHFLQ